VLKAEYKAHKTVAVKKMKPGSIDDEINFNKEAEFMMYTVLLFSKATNPDLLKVFNFFFH
jgi:hypothetical protein